jgi:hypothetical protein
MLVFISRMAALVLDFFFLFTKFCCYSWQQHPSQIQNLSPLFQSNLKCALRMRLYVKKIGKRNWRQPNSLRRLYDRLSMEYKREVIDLFFSSSSKFPSKTGSNVKQREPCCGSVRFLSDIPKRAD